MNLLVTARLAFRAAAGRRMAQVSLCMRVLGVAFATLVLLLAASANGALEERGDRVTWRTHWMPTGLVAEDSWLQVNWSEDYYLGKEISRVQVVQHSPEAEVPPGLDRIPAPGDAFVSPALARLIESDPDVLGQRYGERIVGTITNAGLKDGAELVAISGYAAGRLNHDGLFYRELPGGFHQTGITVFIRAVIVIGVVVLLFPIAMFIAAAARLNAQESDLRLAALRLAGADTQRVRWIVAFEAMISAVPGMLLGLLTFFLVRPLVAQVQFGGSGFFPSDFALGWLSLAVLMAVPVVVVGASLAGLRDVEISPLGVSRRSLSRDVRPIGLLFFLPGFALLWFVLEVEAGRGERVSGIDPLIGLGLSMILILIGVTLLGTWLGQCVARALASRATSGSALLAFRRIVADPQGSFRTVSGVTFAVFAGTLFLSLSAALEREVAIEPLSGLRPNVVWVGHQSIGSESLEGLPPGTVTAVINSLSGVADSGWYLNVQQGDCETLSTLLRMEGGCGGRVAVRQGSGIEPGDSFLLEGMETSVRIEIPSDAHVFEGADFGWVPDVLLPPHTVAWFDDLGGGTLVIAPPGGEAGGRELEMIRTAIIRAYPSAYIYSGTEYDASALSGLSTMQNLVYMGTFAAFALSGGTAAMAVASSIFLRRRAFALLRMAGCSLGVLRRTILAEATLPLALVSFLSATTAVGVSSLMISRIGQGSILPPIEFALPLFAGLALGLLLPLMTLPLLGAVTRSEQTRFE